MCGAADPCYLLLENQCPPYGLVRLTCHYCCVGPQIPIHLIAVSLDGRSIAVWLSGIRAVAFGCPQANRDSWWFYIGIFSLFFCLLLVSVLKKGHRKSKIKLSSFCSKRSLTIFKDFVQSIIRPQVKSRKTHSSVDAVSDGA